MHQIENQYKSIYYLGWTRLLDFNGKQITDVVFQDQDNVAEHVLPDWNDDVTHAWSDESGSASKQHIFHGQWVFRLHKISETVYQHFVTSCRIEEHIADWPCFH